MTVLTTFNMDQFNVFGLDPFLVLGLITVGSGGVGWLLGPFVGNAVFGMAHRRVGPQVAEVSLVRGCERLGGGLFFGGTDGRMLMKGVFRWRRTFTGG